MGAGPRTKQIGTRFFSVQERVQDGDLRVKKVPHSKICEDVGRNQSLLQCYNSIAHLLDWYSADRGSRTPLQDDGTPVESTLRWMWNTERNRQLTEFVGNIETGAKL